MPPSNQNPPTLQYQLAGRLDGERGDALNCVAINGQGNLLASGGDEGMRIWDLNRLEKVPSLARQHAFYDPVSAAMWMTCKTDAHETLCFGTGLGYLILWRQTGTAKMVKFEEVIVKRVGTGCKITCMTNEANPTGAGVRLATGTRERQVIVWTFDGDILVPSTSIQLATTVPKGIAFVSGQKDVYVWGMYDGQMLTVRSDGRVMKTTGLSTAIGGVAIHEKQMVFLIDNVTDGFSLHSVESGHLIRSYPTKPTVAKAKQVAFGEKGAIVVGGGNHGLVYIFDRKQGNQLQCLQHGKEGMVQTVAVHNAETHTTIIAAMSSNVPNPSISIWKRKHHRPENSSTTSKKAEAQDVIHTLNTIFMTAVQLVFLSVLTVLLMNAAGWQINWQNGTVADIIAALVPSMKGEDPTLVAVRAEWEKVKEEVTKYQAAQWQMMEELVETNITEPALSVEYDSPPAIPKTPTRSDGGLSMGNNGSGGRNRGRAAEVEAVASSVIFI